MIKLLVGLLKGAVIGGAVGYGAYTAHLSATWLACGVVGALVGLLVGRPIWSLLRDKDSTSVVALLKMAFGFGVGVGLWALVAKAWNPSHDMLKIEQISTESLLWWSPTLCAAVGAVYGAFVEVDDGVGHNPAGDAAGGKAIVPAKPKK